MCDTTFKKTLFLLHLLKHDFIGAFGFNIGLILKDEMQKILLPLIKHGFFLQSNFFIFKQKEIRLQTASKNNIACMIF